MPSANAEQTLRWMQLHWHTSDLFLGPGRGGVGRGQGRDYGYALHDDEMSIDAALCILQCHTHTDIHTGLLV